MVSSGKVMAFVATTDPEKARAFYEGTLGLRVLSDDPFAMVLDAGGTKIRVQKVPSFTPQPFTALGWEVADMRKTVQDLHAKGVSFERYGHFEQDELGIWTAPGGAQVAWFKDPDGNTLSVSSG